ncbi:MAG: hypothetical protein Q4A55_07545 [Aerococcus sp.]|nr:hypothetical protein [Aerococcus sp.]
MQIKWSPQIGGDIYQYQFNQDVMKATQGDAITFFDCSNVKESQTYEPAFPLIEVRREDGELYVTLFQGVTEGDTLPDDWTASKDEPFEVTGAVIQPKAVDQTIPHEDLMDDQLKALQEENETLKDLIQELALMTYDS